MAKRYFKKVAKGFENDGRLETQETDVDSEIATLLRDQEQVFASMKCSRLCRIKQRDYVNRTHRNRCTACSLFML